MKIPSHPNFILGAISLVLLIIGVGIRANGFAAGDYVLGAAVLIGAVHWIWSIVDVFKNYRVHSRSENRIIWIILVIIIPPLGGMLYYMMSKTLKM